MRLARTAHRHCISRGACRLQLIHEHACDVEPRLIGDLLETGGAGYVDLGQEIPDDIQTHQQQTPFPEFRAQCARYFQVAL